jgi:hypothetical protein
MYIVGKLRAVSSLGIPPPPMRHGGGCGLAKKICGAPYQPSEGNLLRLRCDARGFKRSAIEIIARQKATPAFEGERKEGPTIRVQGYGCFRSIRVVVLGVFST